jgi:replication fork protection complex subunit Csm3/Swi3
VGRVSSTSYASSLSAFATTAIPAYYNMAYAASPTGAGGSHTDDELDRLLDMDNAVDDFLNDVGVRSGEQGNSRAPQPETRDEDQEVQVKKKRNPVPKLDENR